MLLSCIGVDTAQYQLVRSILRCTPYRFNWCVNFQFCTAQLGLVSSILNLYRTTSVGAVNFQSGACLCLGHSAEDIDSNIFR